MKFQKGQIPWNKGKPAVNKNCPKCGCFLGKTKHECRSVELRGDRFCLDCKKELKNSGYERYHNVCPRCNKIRWKKREKELRAKLIFIFGGKCETCGYNKYSECLEFHNLDSSLKHKKHFLKLIEEHPNKFRLLCNRCHREEEIKIRHENFKKTKEVKIEKKTEEPTHSGQAR